MSKNLIHAAMIGDKVAIRLDNPKDMTAGGIALPEKSRSEMSEVVAVGPGKYELSDVIVTEVDVLTILPSNNGH